MKNLTYIFTEKQCIAIRAAQNCLIGFSIIRFEIDY